MPSWCFDQQQTIVLAEYQEHGNILGKYKEYNNVITHLTNEKICEISAIEKIKLNVTEHPIIKKKGEGQFFLLTSFVVTGEIDDCLNFIFISNTL